MMLSVEYQAELALLFGEMEDHPDDIFELYEKIHEKLNEMRAFGLEVPQDLKNLEAYLKETMAVSAQS